MGIYMKIVWLTPEIPYPPIGGRNGVYNRIVQLSKTNEIFLISIAYNSEEKKSTSDMKQFCREVYYYDRSEYKIRTYLKSLVMPYSVASRYRKDIVNKIQELISRERIDLVIVDFPNMAKNVIRIKKTNPALKITINQHNVEFKRMREMNIINTIPMYKRIAYWLESLRLELYERNLYKKNIFEAITFFSEDDRKFFENHINVQNTICKTIPLGANDYNVEPLFLNNKTMVFVGRLDSIAVTNVEAVLWFIKSVFPLILKKVTDVKLIIAGANPCDEIKECVCSNVEIIPNFESLKDVYDKTDIVILPLLSGGGVKGKLLEAIAFRKHIVTTSHGIEGTLFEDKKHVALCDDAESFANACIDIMLNLGAYEKREKDAYNLFKSNYDWNAIGTIYNEFLTKLVKRNNL